MMLIANGSRTFTALMMLPSASPPLTGCIVVANPLE